MSMRELEAAVLAGARVAFSNPKLRKKDLMEWSTGKIKPRHGEVVLFVPDPGVYVAVQAAHDKRQAAR